MFLSISKFLNECKRCPCQNNNKLNEWQRYEQRNQPKGNERPNTTQPNKQMSKMQTGIRHSNNKREFKQQRQEQPPIEKKTTPLIQPTYLASQIYPNGICKTVVKTRFRPGAIWGLRKLLVLDFLRGFFFRYSGFPLFTKTKTLSEFQLDQRTRARAAAVVFSLNIVI